jgi:hypothetical protein
VPHANTACSNFFYGLTKLIHIEQAKIIDPHPPYHLLKLVLQIAKVAMLLDVVLSTYTRIQTHPSI